MVEDDGWPSFASRSIDDGQDAKLCIVGEVHVAVLRDPVT